MFFIIYSVKRNIVNVSFGRGEFWGVVVRRIRTAHSLVYAS